MWINTRDHNPDKDGVYLVQMASGSKNGLSYTVGGGWNTEREKDGTIWADAAMTNVQVARWFDAPEPEPVPREWYDEWMEA